MEFVMVTVIIGVALVVILVGVALVAILVGVVLAIAFVAAATATVSAFVAAPAATALAGTLLATCLVSRSAPATSLPVLKGDATPGIVTLRHSQFCSHGLDSLKVDLLSNA